MEPKRITARSPSPANTIFENAESQAWYEHYVARRLIKRRGYGYTCIKIQGLSNRFEELILRNKTLQAHQSQFWEWFRRVKETFAHHFGLDPSTFPPWPCPDVLSMQRDFSYASYEVKGLSERIEELSLHQHSLKAQQTEFWEWSRRQQETFARHLGIDLSIFPPWPFPDEACMQGGLDHTSNEIPSLSSDRVDELLLYQQSLMDREIKFWEWYRRQQEIFAPHLGVDPSTLPPFPLPPQ